jgi:hypothetical protein
MTGGTVDGVGGIPNPVPEDVLSVGDAGHQGYFGEQFIMALATAANLDVTKVVYRDRFGVDWKLNYPGRSGTTRFPAIEVQVKSWSNPRGSEHAWQYPLGVRNFNMLAGRDYQVPRFLFLVVVPADAAAWVSISPDRLVLRHAAYWVCLHDEEPLADRPATSTYTVSVPRANLLDVGSLHGLFGTEFRERLVS